MRDKSSTDKLNSSFLDNYDGPVAHAGELSPDLLKAFNAAHECLMAADTVCSVIVGPLPPTDDCIDLVRRLVRLLRERHNDCQDAIRAVLTELVVAYSSPTKPACHRALEFAHDVEMLVYESSFAATDELVEWARHLTAGTLPDFSIIDQDKWPAIHQAFQEKSFANIESLSEQITWEISKVQAARPTKMAAKQSPAAETAPVAASGNNATIALVRVFTNGIADDRINKAALLLDDHKLTVNVKLTKIDALLSFPTTASAAKLGEMLGVTKQAILKTDWWFQKRRGEKANEIGRREDMHRERAKSYEAPSQDDEYQ